MKTDAYKNDEEIIDGILKNQESANWEFSRKYSGIILKLCYVSCRNEHDAEELLNDVLYKVFRRIGTYDPKTGNLAGWVREVTRNHLRDVARMNKNHVYETSLDENYLTKAFICDPEAGYNNENTKGNSPCDSDPRIICLNKAMKKINPRDQLVLQYRANGFEYNEIMEFLQINYKAATTAYSRAVIILKEEYYNELAAFQN